MHSILPRALIQWRATWEVALGQWQKGLKWKHTQSVTDKMGSQDWIILHGLEVGSLPYPTCSRYANVSPLLAVNNSAPPLTDALQRGVWDSHMGVVQHWLPFNCCSPPVVLMFPSQKGVESSGLRLSKFLLASSPVSLVTLDWTVTQAAAYTIAPHGHGVFWLKGMKFSSVLIRVRVFVKNNHG